MSIIENVKARLEETPVERAVRVLNELFEVDGPALHTLVCVQVPTTNQKFAEEHPTIEFGMSIAPPHPPVLSMLGLINGIVAHGGEMVGMSWTEPDVETKRCTMLGFVVVRREDCHPKLEEESEV